VAAAAAEFATLSVEPRRCNSPAALTTMSGRTLINGMAHFPRLVMTINLRSSKKMSLSGLTVVAISDS